MRINREEKEAIGRVSNRVLKEVLKREAENHLLPIKSSKDVLDIRHHQGALYVIDEILKVIK